MNDVSESGPLDCRRAREAIHGLLDSEIIDAEIKQNLRTHLVDCGDCREFEIDMRAIQNGLRAIPELTFPDEALREVWSRSSGSAVTSRSWGYAAAVAAVLLLALVGVWQWNNPEPTPSRAELERAARQTRMVLRLTAQAMHRTERAAIGDVLTEEVSPALRRVPIEWPGALSAQRRGS